MCVCVCVYTYVSVHFLHIYILFVLQRSLTKTRSLEESLSKAFSGLVNLEDQLCDFFFFLANQDSEGFREILHIVNMSHSLYNAVGNKRGINMYGTLTLSQSLPETVIFFFSLTNSDLMN